MKVLKEGASFAATLGIPLLYLLNLSLAFHNFELVLFPLSILGTIVAGVGVLIWIISMVNLGKSFGVLPQKQKKVKTGLYKYFNHPMYIGISAAIIGISVANISFAGLTFYCLITLPLLILRARLEEKNLN